MFEEEGTSRTTQKVNSLIYSKANRNFLIDIPCILQT